MPLPPLWGTNTEVSCPEALKGGRLSGLILVGLFLTLGRWEGIEVGVGAGWRGEERAAFKAVAMGNVFLSCLKENACQRKIKGKRRCVCVCVRKRA